MSMKKIKYCTYALMAMMGLSSCEKEIMSYEGVDGLYFDVRWGSAERDPETQWGHQSYTPVEFGNMTEESYTVQLRVRTSGTAKDYDRPFSIIIGKDSTNAIAGEDYVEFAKDYVIKAGEQFAYIDVTINRTERMQNDTVALQLRLIPNEYFTCPFTNYEDNPVFDAPEKRYGYNPDATVHKIVACDVMAKPEGWWGDFTGSGGGPFGKYSRTKWMLMMEVTNTTVEDYASRIGTNPIMPMARANAISETFANYLLEEAKKGREHAILDEDNTMMWCSYVNTIDPNAWKEFDTPDDYYKGE